MKINRLCTVEEKKTKGIYKISNTFNNKVYVGSSKRSFRIRWNCHSAELFGGYHPNKHLQRAFNLYECEWNFEILEIIQDNSLIRSREMSWINKFKSEKVELFNNHDVSEDDLFIHSEETKRKISVSKKGQRKGIRPKNFNDLLASRERAIVELENGIIIREYESTKKAGEILKLNYKAINNVLRGITINCRGYPNKTWKYKDGLPPRKLNRVMVCWKLGKKYPIQVTFPTGEIKCFLSCDDVIKEIPVISSTHVRYLCRHPETINKYGYKLKYI